MRGAPTFCRAALLCAALAACGGGGGEPPPPPPPPEPPLGVERVFPALSFSQPVAMLQAPGNATRWFVVEQAGRVRVFANNPQVGAFTTFAEISGRVTSGGEMGLLGMAFHPQFPIDPRVFLSYTNDSPPDGRVSRISQFTLDAGGNLDPLSEQILMKISQPETNHNGGNIAFGPDGLLYIGIGDGGGGNDQHGAIGNGQLMATLLGKMLRIDVSPAAGYAIPPGNPFFMNAQCGAGGTGSDPCPEIFASGFRNPWRWSFDAATLWVGDVGQDELEEVDRVSVGGNYGWRCFEGTRATGLACGSEPNLLAPVAQYGRSVGASITGGYVYRGSAIAGLFGRYVFADFVSGRLMHIGADAQPTVTIAAGFDTGLNISSFGRDAAGELYVVDYGGGLYRVVPR
jgi:glucose/arabinose dehydrogenase